MSISSISSSALASQLDSSLNVRSTAAGSSAQGSRAVTAPQSNLASDIASLLKDLASGNVSQSKSDLAKLQSDLKVLSPTFAPNSNSALPLTKLLNNLSISIASGDTTQALTSLVGFLVKSGNTTGNAVNTSV